MRKKLQIVMTVWTLLVCAAICWSVLSLYRAGYVRHASSGPVQPIFTWEDTAARMRYLLPLIALFSPKRKFEKLEKRR